MFRLFYDCIHVASICKCGHHKKVDSCSPEYIDVKTEKEALLQIIFWNNHDMDASCWRYIPTKFESIK